jgi:antiviral helicase SKI2
MASGLAEAMQRLQVGDSAAGERSGGASEAFDIDSILFEQRPRKKAKQDPEELKRGLENEFLYPSATFSQEWLNRFQQ